MASSLDVGDQVFDAYFPMGVGIPNAYFQNKYAIDFGYGIDLERYATIRNTGPCSASARESMALTPAPEHPHRLPVQRSTMCLIDENQNHKRILNCTNRRRRRHAKPTFSLALLLRHLMSALGRPRSACRRGRLGSFQRCLYPVSHIINGLGQIRFHTVVVVCDYISCPINGCL